MTNQLKLPSEAMASMETVEINPAIEEHNRTATLGVELASLPSARNPVAFRQPPFACHHKSASFVAGDLL